MSGRAKATFPDVTELRRFLPAVEAGVRALREREGALEAHFEPVGMELEELRTLLDGMGAEDA